jgi:hypothetical protein
MFPLEQARIAIQQGDREKAKAILANLVKTEPQNSNAWLLLAEVLDNPQQASYCRERAQTILKNQAQQNIATPAKSINDGSKKVQAKCPFCAELIPSDAIVCPYCGRNLSNQAAQVMNSPQRVQPKPVASSPVNKQSSYGTNVFLAILVGIVLVCGFIFLMGALEGTSIPDVRYEVIGSSNSANILWFNAQGGIEQGDYNLPFRKSFSFSNGEYVSLVATSYDSGTVTCQIWVNDKLWRESTSSGAYSVVSCNGILGQP